MKRLPVIAVLLLAATFSAHADYYIITGSGYRSIGGASRLGPYATREEAEGVNNQSFNGEATIEGSDSGGGSSSGSSGAGFSTGDPVFDAMLPFVQLGANMFGRAFGNAIRGDPAERARQAREAERRRAYEQAVREANERFKSDMTQKEARESARIAEERHNKILNRLRRLGDGVFADTENSFDVVDLRPGGTSFFGLGGDQSARDPMYDSHVVDLRDYRRAEYLGAAAVEASSEDAGLLLDEGLRVARGGSSFVMMPDENLPKVGEDGLLAFQKANAEYAKANDFRARMTTTEQEHLRAAEVSAQAEKEARDKYEAMKAAGASPEELEAQRVKTEGAFAAARRDRDAWEKVHAETLEAQTTAAVQWANVRETFQTSPLGQDPARFEKSPPAGYDEASWKTFQEGIVASREKIEADQSRIMKEVDAIQIPAPAIRAEHVHEGVILGMYTTQEQADKLMKEGHSPFGGQSYTQMNNSAFWNTDKQQGALAVSFGTPEGAAAGGAQEVARVLGDHITGGEVSLRTPQAEQALAQLEGKSFDRLLAHSNGTPITLALIDSGRIHVNELHIAGGDRSLEDGRYMQKLLDEGKVKRVVVWVHTNDPVPWGTSVIPVRSDEGILLAKHVVRKASGTAASGDQGVQYIIERGPDANGDLLRPHYLQESYFGTISKTYGVTPR